MSQEVSLKLNSPNDEQKKAIEHRGGVLLSAGAGSGKTFVLVEHAVYLFREYYKTVRDQPEEIIRSHLKKEFSKIVLMTFTKKAAGELSLRLKRRFELGQKRSEANLDELSSKVWEFGKEAISHMYVGTIHGFCFRLIAQGVVSGLSVDSQMIDDIQLKEKIRGIVEKWLIETKEDLDPSLRDYILFNKRAVLGAIVSIFKDPDLRLGWSQQAHSVDIDIKESVKDLIDYLLPNWNLKFDTASLNTEVEGNKTPKWVDFIKGFSDQVKMNDAWDFFVSSKHFCDDFGRSPAVRAASVSEDIYNFFQEIKKLKKAHKDYFAELDTCLVKEDELKEWNHLISNLYQYVEQEYKHIDGITFGDLEFFVCKSLREGSVPQEILDRFSYFIIDEFQDTSQIQFDIIRMIVSNDMSKIFSVGDVKQAIYGFRGGELGVFQEASQTTYQNLSLKNNYRSDEKVIQFNNDLFRYLLPLGPEYSGHDTFTVPMTEQLTPDHRLGTGRVVKRKVSYSGELEEGKKGLSTAEINYLEARELFEIVKEKKDENVCILYSKLRPSHYLLEMLISEGLDFNFQVKVPLSEDPVVYLFSTFCQYHGLLKENKAGLEQARFLFREVLDLLGVQAINDEEIRELLQESHGWNKSFGAFETFKKFLWRFKVSTSNINSSWSFIKTLCDIGEDDFLFIYEFIKVLSDGSYSIDFQSGAHAEKVTVMTVHASKGLEFDTVLLGGVHTNGDKKSSMDSFGKEFFSYKWFSRDDGRKSLRTPNYIKEYLIGKDKDFGEAKRLFYVALTRAVHEICWVDLYLNETPLVYSKNSWINGLRKWEESEQRNESLDMNTFEVSILEAGLDSKRLDLNTPIVHSDSLGILQKNSTDHISELVLGSELSVTSLTLLGDCPRKFYLRNLLKFEPGSSAGNNTSSKNDVLKSSAQRGTSVHEQLSWAIQRNFSLEMRSDLDEKTLSHMQWCLDILREYKEREFTLISEEGVKFSLFGQMISGTPDLVLRSPHGRNLEIWDFKTGRYTEEKCSPYWLQLMCYAYALYNVKDSIERSEDDISLKLVFIDERKIIEKKMGIDEVESSLFTLWSKLKDLDQINQDHCTKCFYQELCGLQ